MTRPLEIPVNLTARGVSVRSGLGSGVCQREHVVMRSKVFCTHRDRNVCDWGPQGQMGFLTVLYPKPTYFLFVL